MPDENDAPADQDTAAAATASRLLITLCTYNECENLPLLIPEIHKHASDADVLVIDDNSPDGTGKLADEMSQADSRIHVLHRADKQGLGAATVAGFKYAVEQKYDLRSASSQPWFSVSRWM